VEYQSQGNLIQTVCILAVILLNPISSICNEVLGRRLLKKPEEAEAKSENLPPTGNSPVVKIQNLEDALEEGNNSSVSKNDFSDRSST
jgi:hypothetical protein